ncbi:HNH/ENDO VII family nuclease [Sphingomonas hankookensis]|uniref:HNH/ENDO VII family nuclease n=1 Tax=Sphingomonas hankookensis TaxID=563996 RepID=UPI003B66C4E4
MDLHHSRQDARVSLFELSQSTHRAPRNAGGAAFHPYRSNKNPHYPVDRVKFRIDRKQYWIDRAVGVAP